MTAAFTRAVLVILLKIYRANCHDAVQEVSALRRPSLETGQQRKLPRKVLIGYASSNYTNVLNAVMEDGVNVVIWAFMDVRSTGVHASPSSATEIRDLSRMQSQGDAGANTLVRKLIQLRAQSSQSYMESTNATITTNLDFNAIASVIQQLNAFGYSRVLHLVSVGGWNSPHLDESLSPTEWFAVWKSSVLSQLFQGIDWDFEGNDVLDSKENVFTVQCLNKMGEISRLLKEEGYIVTTAPPQSYLNTRTQNFSRYVNLTSPTRTWHPKFHYFGSNVYAYFLARFGENVDLVSIQFYESYSDAAMAVFHDKMSPGDYIFDFMQELASQHFQFYVDFSQDTLLDEMTGQYVSLPLDKIVIGLANGWALEKRNRNKVLYISPEQCKNAYDKLKVSSDGDLTPRGFMFWTIEERGKNGVYLAKGLSHFLLESAS
eukprot:CCRYP_019268-RA/>CCRYP_019268-RA protein AED:0.00 eAED:0.00 QI:246/1/1/1/0.5/0.33/3/786/430